MFIIQKGPMQAEVIRRNESGEVVERFRTWDIEWMMAQEVKYGGYYMYYPPPTWTEAMRCALIDVANLLLVAFQVVILRRK